MDQQAAVEREILYLVNIQVWNQVRDQVLYSINNQIDDQIGNSQTCWYQVWNQVRVSTRNQVVDQVGARVYDQAREDTYDSKGRTGQ